ncbi:MAG: hypothetical protein HXX80_02010 [Nitrososphaerales archaeon]|nr:hypothetical protein [Nitrososphaerales archaeon]
MSIGARAYTITVIVLVVSTALGFYLYPKSLLIYDGFEDCLCEWAKGAHAPQDPNNLGNEVFWDIFRTASVAHSGIYSLNLSIDGRQDDGTIWIERRVPVNPNSNIRVKVFFWLYSEFESQANTIAGVVAYIGMDEPKVEEDFQRLGTANQVSGWKEYYYSKSLNTGAGDEVWISFGITVLWETYMSYAIDDVRIIVN